MKESKFIELLNLYVDNQISPSEAAWLESEIQQKPARRQIYRQYCQMHKACVMLAENFRTSVPVAAVSGDTVVAFQPAGRRLARATYALGAFAAAACVALVVMNRRNLFAPGDAARQASMAQAAMVADATTTHLPDTRGLVPNPPRPALQPAFAGLVRENAGSDGALTANNRATFEWMTRVRLDRVPVDQMWFEAQPTLQTQELMFHARPSNQTQAENAAFRFQR
ncbi:MAG TPA: hypothetical protein VG710_17985 [Opitutus sp.]|nr:hypothetical protein [Opitutus sp.]